MRTALLILFSALTLIGCDENYVAKPRGYFRIALPEKNYVSYDAPCNTTFDIPSFTKIEVINQSSDSCWYNLYFPRYNARIHCTYLHTNGSLTPLIEDAYNFAFKHESKANAIRRIDFKSDSTSNFGMLYELTGDVASPLQFFVSDSASHFLRGSLYFNHRSNADSVQPVVDYFKADIEHLMNTVRWTN